MNNAMPNLNIQKENVIGLAFEPIYFLGLTTQFIEYAKKHIGKYYIGDKFDLPAPFIEHFAYMWHSRPSKEITTKNKLMSINFILSSVKSEIVILSSTIFFIFSNKTPLSCLLIVVSCITLHIS